VEEVSVKGMSEKEVLGECAWAAARRLPQGLTWWRVARSGRECDGGGVTCEPAQMYTDTCASCCVPVSVWCVNVDRCIEEIPGDGHG